MSANLDRVATFMRELADTAAREMTDSLGLAPERASEAGLRLAQRVCDEFGGQLIYIPLGLAIRITERDKALYAAYVANGRDVSAVAKEFEVSVQTAYKRIRLIEAAAYADRQGTLFDAAPDDGPGLA